MKRGDLVTVAVSGDYGKPRPALVAQADAFDQHPSVIVLPLTSELHDAPLFRINVPVGVATGSFTSRDLSGAGAEVVLDSLTGFPDWYRAAF